jgi:murein DD-endopeptidase MepM/ murein hydrolase activator NlpD
MDENEMANAIIQSAGDQISEGTALYLDGELTAVCSDGNALRDYLAAMLDPYEEEGDDPNVSVGFNKQVTLEDGLYFKEGLQDFETVRQELVGVKQAQKVYTVKAGDTLWSIAHNNDLTFRELCALNPAFKGEPLSETSSILEGDHLVITKEEAGLEVRITRIETREEEIAFSTETTRSNEYTKGTTKVLQEGENGLRRVTLQNVYDTNNILVDQSVLSTEVIKEPVNKKVVEGTKKVTSSTKYITGSGQFIWPVPNYRYCSRWYGGRHKGVDICAPAGTPIYASAGGTVTKAGYNKAGAGTGYGYSVIINHGGGYSSVYAHCLSLTVSAGQTVKQGQLIGYLGSTGRSTGNHCHFEIRLNGSYIPPQNVFPGKK